MRGHRCPGGEPLDVRRPTCQPLEPPPGDPHGPAQPHHRDAPGRDELVQGRARDPQELGRPRDGQQGGPSGAAGAAGPCAARTGQAGSSTVKRAWPHAGQRTAGPGMGDLRVAGCDGG